MTIALPTDDGTERPAFVSLGMFIIDQFEYLDENGNKTDRATTDEIGGGGTYAAVGARTWLPPKKVGMVVDRGDNFPLTIQADLEKFGAEMWLFRDQPGDVTTRALNTYRGDFRSFEYLTPRIRITPTDLKDTRLERPSIIHFICSPSRAAVILSELQEEGWDPITIYEPIPYRCMPAELPALKKILGSLSILSPNAEEALSLLSIALPVTKDKVEQAAKQFLEFGVGRDGKGAVIIRCGHLGAYTETQDRGGKWTDAYWTTEDPGKIVDVTGAGNSFLGGLAGGLELTGDVYKAVLYATVSASFTIEQYGLPVLTGHDSEGRPIINGESPNARLQKLTAGEV